MPYRAFIIWYKMITDKTIRTLLPFIVVFITTFFISGTDIFQSFGPRDEQIPNADKLLKLLTVGFTWMAVICIVPSYVFFKAYRHNIGKGAWYADLYWQISGTFFCWFLLGLISAVGLFQTYLWVTGLLWLYSGVFITYMVNTLWKCRKLLYHPESPSEMLLKAQKFDELIELIHEHNKNVSSE